MVELVLRPSLNEIMFEKELDKIRGFYPKLDPSRLTRTVITVKTKSIAPWGS